MTIFRYDVIAKIFSRCFVSLIKFSYWSKFHVSIITGLLVLELWQFSFIKDWPEIGNTPVWVLPSIWRLGQVGDTKFGTNVSSKVLLNAAKCQGYSFYRFWVIKWKPTRWGGDVKLPHPPSRLGLNGNAVKAYYFRFCLIWRELDINDLVIKIIIWT